jgi:hypothetical protein
LFLMSETFCLRSRGRVRLDAWCLRHTCARGLVCAPPCIVPPQHCAPHPIWSRTGGRMSPSKISRLFKTASNIPEQALIDQYSLQDTQSSENSSTEQRQGQKQTHSPVVPDINASGIVRPKTEVLLTLFPSSPSEILISASLSPSLLPANQCRSPATPKKIQAFRGGSLLIAANAARSAELSTPSIILRMLHNRSDPRARRRGLSFPSLVPLAGGSDHYST